MKTITLQAPPGFIARVHGRYVRDVPTELPNTRTVRRQKRLGRLIDPKDAEKRDPKSIVPNRKPARVLKSRSMVWPSESEGTE